MYIRKISRSAHWLHHFPLVPLRGFSGFVASGTGSTCMAANAVPWAEKLIRVRCELRWGCVLFLCSNFDQRVWLLAAMLYKENQNAEANWQYPWGTKSLFVDLLISLIVLGWHGFSFVKENFPEIKNLEVWVSIPWFGGANVINGRFSSEKRLAVRSLISPGTAASVCVLP